MVYEFDGYIPNIHSSCYIHPSADIIGNVVIGKEVYIGPSASLRGDFGKIIIEDGCNIQENCTIHMFPGEIVHLKKNTHIGHGAVIHGAKLGQNVLVGINSVVLDDAIIGDNCIIGALSLVKANTNIPDGKLIIGNPGKIVKNVSEKMLKWKNKGTLLYKNLTLKSKKTMKLSELNVSLKSKKNKIQPKVYNKWHEIK